MLNEKTVNLVKRAVKAGNAAPTIAQLKTLATAIGDVESYKALNTVSIHDIIDIKKKCVLFGKDKADKVSEGKGNLFGLSDKDTTIASEKQGKIYDVKPMEKPDIKMKDIAERKKVEEFHPETSDRKVETKTVSEPLKEKPQFPEVLNRGEKQQKEIAKETKASKKRAWTEDESDVTPVAKEVMDIGYATWEKNGWEDGSMVKMDVLKEALKDIAPRVTLKDMEVLEDYNNHSEYQAISELNSNALTASIKTSNTSKIPTHVDDSLLDGFSISDLIDTVIHNEPTRDPQAVQRVFKEMLDFSVQNANETLNSELPMILSEISDYEKRGSKTAAENPFEKSLEKDEKQPKEKAPEKGEKVEKAPKVEKDDKPEKTEPKEPKEPKEKSEKPKEPTMKDIMEILEKLTKMVDALVKHEEPVKSPKVEPRTEVPAADALKDMAPKTPVSLKVELAEPKEAVPVAKPVVKTEPKINPVKKLIQSLQKVISDFAPGDIVEVPEMSTTVTVENVAKTPDNKTVLVGKDSSGNPVVVPEGTAVKQDTVVKPVL